MSLSNLKRNRADFLNTLVTQAAKLNTSKNDYTDARIWKPSRDSVGNGYAEIRFLPQVEGEASPFVRYWDHFFKGPTGQYYIEKSLTTLGENDPIGEYNSKLWNSDEDKNSPLKKQARDQKRKLHYVTNIYVISDPSVPENNGKVFLYDFGKKIFDKITQAMEPEYPDEKPMNPFDLWSGANFKLKVRQYEGWPNYDRSEFAPAGPLADDDKLDEIYSKAYGLNEFVEPAGFKSYDELKARLDIVMGTNSNDTYSPMSESPAPTIKETPSTLLEDDPIVPEEYWGSNPVDEGELSKDDDTMDYFNKLLEDD